MNCQEEQMTQQMWDAMPEGMTVNYVRQMEVMNVEPTVSVFNGATHHWDADVGAWYATRITNMDAVMRAYRDRVDGVADVQVNAETERVYA
ncbi:MAG: hypothetical protein CMA72_08340 [Euryarchaeota archaeon]|nr:hypothetical protein [Euryarchaeota archaeon]|tara:strand:+ start:1352 stop:1624 length:273 start_codon:yes stop_codon:yes gene_type:complete